VKRSVFSLLLAIAIVAVSAIGATASPVSATGHWRLQVTTGNGLTNGYLTFNQVGMTVIGRMSTGGTINGEMVSDTKMNGKWNGPNGAGWITLYFDAHGKTFNGTWGFNGAKANGSFVGQRIIPPTPKPNLSANGSWKIDITSGDGLGTGTMSLTGSNDRIVGKFGSAAINGKMVTDNKMAGTWNGPKGAGWLSLWLNADGKSLSGEWGWKGKTGSGHFVGHRL
jgi:hypothetical protein